MRTDQPASRAIGAGYSFGDVEALAGATCSLENRQLTALVGDNGSGKTTLLRLLGGILSPTSGTVDLFATRVGYLSQGLALDPEMTGVETLRLLASLHGLRAKKRKQRIRELADAFGLSSLLRRPVSTYSGGQRRRLHLAAGMIHDPELLLLDEPGAGLDARATSHLWRELEERAAAGRAVAVVSHDLAGVLSHADRVLVLEGGRLLADTSPVDLLAEQGCSVVTFRLGGEVAAGAVDSILAGCEGIRNHRSELGRHRLELRPDEATRRRILAALADSDLDLAELQVRPPDLASALAHLLGRELEPLSQRKKAPRRKKARRR